jgi:hypothetical protein
MKITGYINYGYRPPAPFVTASILLKELNLRARLPLLVDTGASNTIIMWRDVERLGIDVSKLKPEREFSGIGGLIEAKLILSTLIFRSESGQSVKEEAEAHVVTSTCPHPRLKLLPSILGRDIINRYALNYKFETRETFLEK